MKYRVTITERVSEVREYDFEADSPEKAAQLARIEYVERGINPVVTGVQLHVEDRTFEVGAQRTGSIMDTENQGPFFISVFSDGEVEEMPPLSNYDWVISKGIFERALYGIQGPANGRRTKSQIFKHPQCKRFRVKDDDGEIYYEGRIVMDEECTGFEPLDDYGRPALGATEIEYWEEGEWRGL